MRFASGMSAERTFEILAQGPFRRDQLHISFAAANDLRLDASSERFVARVWRRHRLDARRANVPCYSGRLWRVAAYHLDSEGLHLQIGKTTYRQYVGTRNVAFAGDHPRSELANPLAICAVIVTSDSQIVVVRRAGVDVAAGQYDVPGGFVERGKDSDPFAAIAREVREELGVTVDPGAFVCLGLIYDLWYPHYELCFAACLPSPLASLLNAEPSERESLSPEAIPDRQEALQDFLGLWRDRMSPTGEGCLTLYARHRL